MVGNLILTRDFVSSAVWRWIAFTIHFRASQSARAKGTFRLCGIYQMLVSNVGLGLGDERERGATEIGGGGGCNKIIFQ